jgi:predicted permease
MADRNVAQVDFQPVEEAEEQFRLAESENRAVVESKILVLLLLLGLGAMLGVATFVTIAVAEDSEFRAQVCAVIIFQNSLYFFPIS